MKIEYTYGKKLIEAEIIYSNRKTLDLRVFPDGNVRITAPLETSVDKILEKIKPKFKWIIQQQRSFELYRPFDTTRLYIPGETHRYLGRQYKLVVNKKDFGNTKISLQKGLFTITSKKDDISTIIQKFYKEKADTLFCELLDKLIIEFPQFSKFKIKLSHRFMRKRWGTCTTDGNIILNTELIKASKACIEYVLVHELCHLIYPNHSKDFYNYLTQLMPNWQKLKSKLESSIG